MKCSLPWFRGAVFMLAAALGLLFLGCLGCNSEHPSGDDDTGSSTDGDADADTDADTDADCDAEIDEVAACAGCPGPVCIARISGHLLFEDDTPVADQFVQVCVADNCFVPITDANGCFVKDFQPTCEAFDFSIDDPFHFTLPNPDPGYAVYSVAYAPTQDQVSDLGVEDFRFDMGTHYFYSLPVGGTEYTPTGGATVSLAGLDFQVPAGALGDQATTIKVIDGLSLGSIPPFVGNPYYPGAVGDLDGLFFIAPYWWEIETPGVELRMAAPGDWTDTDTGSLYLLGDYRKNQNQMPLAATCPCGGADVPVGELHECCAASYDTGEVVFDPISRFGWIGVKKN